jgi:hypothetical protein
MYVTPVYFGVHLEDSISGYMFITFSNFALTMNNHKSILSTNLISFSVNQNYVQIKSRNPIILSIHFSVSDLMTSQGSAFESIVNSKFHGLQCNPHV